MSLAINLVVVDTETGGLDPDKHCIIEIAATLVSVMASEVTTLHKYYDKLTPDRPVNEEAANVNGYTPEKWAHASSLRHGLSGFLDWCHRYAPDGSMWCGANVGFDLAFLKSDLSRSGLKMPEHFSYRKLDTQSLCFPLFATGRTLGVGLRHLRQWAGISGDQAHTAREDVADTVAVLAAYLKHIKRLPSDYHSWTGATLDAPPGFDSWLDYAVATMDTRELHLKSIGYDSDDNGPWGQTVQRDEFEDAAKNELRRLRSLWRLKDKADGYDAMRDTLAAAQGRGTELVLRIQNANHLLRTTLNRLKTSYTWTAREQLAQEIELVLGELSPKKD